MLLGLAAAPVAPLTPPPTRRLQDGVPPLTVTAASGAAGGAKKGGKGGKGGSVAGGGSLQLDDEWVVEHAAMVERLLPGGKMQWHGWPLGAWPACRWF